MEGTRNTKEEDEKILRLLADLEAGLRKRVLMAQARSPETLFEELESLDLVIDLKSKI